MEVPALEVEHRTQTNICSGLALPKACRPVAGEEKPAFCSADRVPGPTCASVKDVAQKKTKSVPSCSLLCLIHTLISMQPFGSRPIFYSLLPLYIPCTHRQRKGINCGPLFRFYPLPSTIGILGHRAE